MDGATRRRSLPTLVSLFTGAGGLDAGLERAGFSTVSAVDIDADCVATLKLNRDSRVAIDERRFFLDEAAILCGSVVELRARDLRPPDAPPSWHPDLLAGGPPCQPFSSAGKQLGVADPRGKLFLEFVRIARELRPKYILFENVRGLATQRGPAGKPGEVLLSVRDAFEAAGYATSFAILNSADFGAAQRRVRLFMFGARVGPMPAFPPPTHSEADRAPSLLAGVRPWVTLGEFLDREAIVVPPEDVVRPSPGLAKLLAGVDEGCGLRSAGARETTRPGGHWGYKQGTFIASRERPARTVTAAATQDWVREADGSLRRLTVSECAALQGFPSRWRFAGDRVSQFRQIGNAVPSHFGFALGRAIVDALTRGSKRARPSSVPLPSGILQSIAYTEREERRNGTARRKVREALKARTEEAHLLKGTGSHDPIAARASRRSA